MPDGAPTSTAGDSRARAANPAAGERRGGLFADYAHIAGVFDEMRAPNGEARPHFGTLLDELDSLGVEEIGINDKVAAAFTKYTRSPVNFITRPRKVYRNFVVLFIFLSGGAPFYNTPSRLSLYDSTLSTMKFIFYIIALLIIYRSVFGQKIIVEHRYKNDRRNKRPPVDDKPQSGKGDYIDYEEIK